MNKLGIYVHIPFCIKKCSYCDFYSLENTSLSGEYAKRLIQDIYDSKDKTGEYTVDTVYFGGGTPSLLSCADFSAVVSALHDAFDIEKNAEFTIEVNPASVEEDKVQTYLKNGVNRVSVGMQTRNSDELLKIGRIHTNEDFDKTYLLLRSCGISNISVDVMYALPEQSIKTLSNTLDYVIDISPEHISTYCLKLEKGTPMYESGVTLPDEDTQYAMYETISKRLSEAGYLHYEISNFAKKGYESRHNVKYWEMGEYLGFGPGAYSYFDGKRYGYERNLHAYLSGKAKICDVDIIDKKTYDFESIMLGLRLSRGVPIELLDKSRAARLVNNGYAKLSGGRLSLTEKGYFVSNEIICYLTD